jgi:hypothetical protein
VIKYLLALVAVSYALQCLSMGVSKTADVVRHLREHADKIEHEERQPGMDKVRRCVEVLWFGLYLLMAYRLVR